MLPAEVEELIKATEKVAGLLAQYSTMGEEKKGQAAALCDGLHQAVAKIRDFIQQNPVPTRTPETVLKARVPALSGTPLEYIGRSGRWQVFNLPGATEKELAQAAAAAKSAGLACFCKTNTTIFVHGNKRPVHRMLGVLAEQL